jgi:anthranilate/para-aminobenzoate synthase component II
MCLIVNQAKFLYVLDDLIANVKTQMKLASRTRAQMQSIASVKKNLTNLLVFFPRPNQHYCSEKCIRFLNNLRYDSLVMGSLDPDPYSNSRWI